MTISLRLNDNDVAIIKKYAELHGLSVSELVRQTVLSRIEDEFDLEAYDAALREYQRNPKTYTLEEVERELGLR